MKKSFIAIYLIVIHVLLALMLAKTDFIVRYGRKFGVVAPAYRYNGPRMLADKMNVFYERVDKNVPDESIIVIGDSLVQGLCVSACNADRPIINFGIGGDTIEGISVRLQNMQSAKRASLIVVEGGINDLLQGVSDDEFKNRYCSMINCLPRNIKVALVKLFPVANKSSWNISNERLRNLNSWIETIAKGNIVVDIWDELVDKGGGCQCSIILEMDFI